MTDPNQLDMDVIRELLRKTNELIELEQARPAEETPDPGKEEAEKRKHYIRIFAASALPTVIARHPNRGQYHEFTGYVAEIAIKQWEALEWRFKREEGGGV